MSKLVVKSAWVRPLSLFKQDRGILLRSHVPTAQTPVAEPLVFTFLVNVTKNALADANYIRELVSGSPLCTLLKMGTRVQQPDKTWIMLPLGPPIRALHIDWTAVDALEAHLNELVATGVPVPAYTKESLRAAFLANMPHIVVNVIMARHSISTSDFVAVNEDLNDFPWEYCALADVAASGGLGQDAASRVPAFFPQISMIQPRDLVPGLSDLEGHPFEAYKGTLTIAMANVFVDLSPDATEGTRYFISRKLLYFAVVPPIEERALLNTAIETWYYTPKTFSVRDVSVATMSMPTNLIVYADFLADRIYTAVKAAKRTKNTVDMGEPARPFTFDPFVSVGDESTFVHLPEMLKQATARHWHACQMRMTLKWPTAAAQ